MDLRTVGPCAKCGRDRDAGCHDTIEECEAVRPPCLDPSSHHRFLANQEAGAASSNPDREGASDGERLRWLLDRIDETRDSYNAALAQHGSDPVLRDLRWAIGHATVAAEFVRDPSWKPLQPPVADLDLLREAFDALESMPLAAMGHAVETRRKLRARLTGIPVSDKEDPMNIPPVACPECHEHHGPGECEAIEEPTGIPVSDTDEGDRILVQITGIEGFVEQPVGSGHWVRTGKEPEPGLREALARAVEGGWTNDSIDLDLYHSDPVFHAVVYTIRAALRADQPPSKDSE